MSTPRIILVTGAAQNIGAAIAERFLKAGDTVICADLNEPENPGMTFIRTDVADEASVSALMGQIEERYGHLNVLVNNAGFVLRRRSMSSLSKSGIV